MPLQDITNTVDAYKADRRRRSAPALLQPHDHGRRRGESQRQRVAVDQPQLSLAAPTTDSTMGTTNTSTTNSSTPGLPSPMRDTLGRSTANLPAGSRSISASSSPASSPASPTGSPSAWMTDIRTPLGGRAPRVASSSSSSASTSRSTPLPLSARSATSTVNRSARTPRTPLGRPGPLGPLSLHGPTSYGGVDTIPRRSPVSAPPRPPAFATRRFRRVPRMRTVDVENIENMPPPWVF